MEKYYIIGIEADGDMHLISLENEICSLDEIQGAVGGYFETVPISAVPIIDLIMIINEEGKLKNLPYNLAATSLVNHTDRIVGNVAIAAVKGEDIVGFEKKFAQSLLNFIVDAWRKNV